MLCLAALTAAVATGTALSGDNVTLVFAGTSEREVRMGGNERDFMTGAGGGDFFRGAGAGDQLYGDEGDDTLIGDETGQAFTDVLQGGADNDEIAGGDGNDVITAGPGNDLVGSIDFSDRGGPVVTENGDDYFAGNAGDDIMYAGPGTDTLEGGSGVDSLLGGEGADSLAGDADKDSYLGQGGTDMAVFYTATSAVNVSLPAGTATGDGADILESIENVYGSPQGDYVLGDGQANVLEGDNGADNLVGGGGIDTLKGGNQNDTLEVRGDGLVDIVQCGDGTDGVIADANENISIDCEGIDLPGTPTTEIAGPVGTVEDTTADFTLTSNEKGSTFSCKLDDGSFQACSSTPEYSQLSPGEHTLYVKARDISNNEGPQSSHTWTVAEPTEPPDTVAPSVVKVTPANGARNVKRKANVTAEFSEAMDPATIKKSTFKLIRKDNGAAVAATVSYNATTDKAVLNPNKRLAAGKTYVAKLTTGVEDAAGNALAAVKSWKFKTVAP